VIGFVKIPHGATRPLVSCTIRDHFLTVPIADLCWMISVSSPDEYK
jgi:hypothetical protein